MIKRRYVVNEELFKEEWIKHGSVHRLMTSLGIKGYQVQVDNGRMLVPPRVARALYRYKPDLIKATIRYYFILRGRLSKVEEIEGFDGEES